MSLVPRLWRESPVWYLDTRCSFSQTVWCNTAQNRALLKTALAPEPSLPLAFSMCGVSSISTRGFLFGGSGESGESFITSASANSSFPRSKIPFNLAEWQIRKPSLIYKSINGPMSTHLCISVFKKHLLSQKNLSHIKEFNEFNTIYFPL